jgi:hypothetical protein
LRPSEWDLADISFEAQAHDLGAVVDAAGFAARATRKFTLPLPGFLAGQTE